MATFGDLEPDDVWGPDQVDPFAAAVIVFDEVRDVTGDRDRPRFAQLHELEQWVWIVAFARWIDRVRREGTT